MDKRNQLISKLSNAPGLRGKVNAKCIECIYDEKQPGTWRQQIESCASTNCPLYSVRVVPKSDQLGAKAENLCNDLPEKITA